jgi:hypothetical protein
LDSFLCVSQEVPKLAALHLEGEFDSSEVVSVPPPRLLRDLYHSFVPLYHLEELQVVEGVLKVSKEEGENS